MLIVKQIRCYGEFYNRKVAVSEFYTTMSAVHSMLQLFSWIKCQLLTSWLSAHYIASVSKSALAVAIVQYW